MNCNNDLSLPVEWDEQSVIIDDEEFSAVSHEEASKVFEQWQTDDQGYDLDIMEVDEQIGSKLLGDEIFYDPCVSPTCPIEEIAFMNFEDDDIDKFSLSFLEDCDGNTITPHFDERYEETLANLAESMRRSQETRKSLSMKTPKTEKYPRNKSVTGVLSSIEQSSQQLQIYLRQIRQS